MSESNQSSTDRVSTNSQQRNLFTCPLCSQSLALNLYGRHLRHYHPTVNLNAEWNLQLPIQSRFVRCHRCQHICGGKIGMTAHHKKSSRCLNPHSSNSNSQHAASLTQGRRLSSARTHHGASSTSWADSSDSEQDNGQQNSASSATTTYSTTSRLQHPPSRCSRCDSADHLEIDCPVYTNPRGHGLNDHDDTRLERARNRPSSLQTYTSLPGAQLPESHVQETLIQGDGNCLIAAVLDSLKFSLYLPSVQSRQINPTTLRIKIIQWIRDHPDYIFPDGTTLLRQICSSSHFTSIPEYCNQMELCRPSDWRGETEFLILIIIYPINIHIYLDDNNYNGYTRINEYNGNPSDPHATIRLHYTNNRSHYNRLQLSPEGQQIFDMQVAAHTLTIARNEQIQPGITQSTTHLETTETNNRNASHHPEQTNPNDNNNSSRYDHQPQPAARARRQGGLLSSNTAITRSQHSIQYLTEIQAQYMQPLYRIHPTWRRPIVEIITKCMTLATTDDAATRTVNMAGFLTLPGLLVTLVKRYQKTKEAVIDFLRQVASNDSPGHIIITAADTLWQEKQRTERHLPDDWTPPQHHPTNAPDESAQRAIEESTAIAKLAGRAEQRVREYRLSAAAGIVSTIAQRMDRIRHPSLRDQIQKIQSLNPPADDSDILPDKDNDPEGHRVTYDDVITSVRNLSKYSAQGSSGWLNCIIINLLTIPDREDKNAEGESPLMKAAGEAFTTLVNSALDGSMHADIATIWATSRAVLIPKNDDSGGWRPLGIGESWYRLIGRIAIAAQATALGSKLLPLQFAVGVPSGCEIAARTAQIIFDHNASMNMTDAPQMGLITCDIESAFQTQSRSEIYNGLNTLAPQLVRLFRTFYGQPASLYFGSGILAGYNSTGIRQGDPVASAYYCAGTHATLIKLDGVVKEAAREINSRLPAGVIAFADDSTGYIEERGLHIAARKMREVSIGTRMKFNLRKCKIIAHEGRMDRIEDIPVAEEHERNEYLDTQFEVITGKVVLGNPVGEETYRRQQITATVEDMMKPFKGLRHIEPRAALTIMRYCYNARPVFLTRAAEYHLYEEVMGRFDSERDKIIAAIAQTTLTMAASIKCSLPQHLGGLGLRNHKGPAAERGCIEARKKTAQYIADYKQELTPGMSVWQQMEVGRADESIYDAERWQEEGHMVIQLTSEREMELSELLPSDMLALTAHHKKKWLQLYNHFWENGEHHWAASLLSESYRGSGVWLRWTGGIDGRFKFTSTEFMECLRLALCADPFPSPQHKECHCGRHTIQYANEPLHPLTCFFHAPHRNHRHSTLRDQVIDMLKQCFPGATIHREYRVGEHLRTRDGVSSWEAYHADIYMEHDAETLIIDTSITEPTANSAMDRVGSAYETAAAAKRTEERKRTLFGQVVIGRGSSRQVNLADTGITYMPFVMETSGRMGAEAEAFIDNRLKTINSAAVLTFLAKARANIARWNGRMVMESRHRLGWSGRRMQEHREDLRRRYAGREDRYDRTGGEFGEGAYNRHVNLMGLTAVFSRDHTHLMYPTGGNIWERGRGAMSAEGNGEGQLGEEGKEGDGEIHVDGEE